MTIFKPTEKIKFLATQTQHYDRYAGCRYVLERVEVDGKCGLVCVEDIEHAGKHTKVLLEPAYKDIQVHKLSSPKALYDKYAIIADGNRVAHFTLGLNAWVPN